MKKLLFLLTFAFIFLPLNIHAENGTIVNTAIDTIELNSETQRIVAGELPAYSVTTTTPHASIEGYGSNTIWVYMSSGASSWHAFGGETPTAVVDESTSYGMRVKVSLENGYEFADNTKIIFNGQDITGGNSYVDVGFTWGGYAYIDLGIATYEVTYDYNGGSHNGNGIEKFYWVPFVPFLTEENLMEDVVAPEGKRLVAVEVDGVRQELGYALEVNHNATVRYIWEDIPVAPTEIHGINITGLTNPVGGQSADTSGITSATQGVRIKNANWYVEQSYENTASPVTTFTAGVRYMLIMVLELDEGYVLGDDFEDHITLSATPLNGTDFVKEGPDIRASFDATAPQTNPGETNSTIVDPVVDPQPELLKPVISVDKGPNNTLYINWQSNPGATKFEVYRATSNNKKTKWTKFESTDATSYEQLNLTYGTTYYYKVKACNVNNCTDYSNVASKKVVPDDVKNLKVDKAGAKNIQVSWDKVGVNGYEVQRSTNNKKWSKVSTLTKNTKLSYNNKKLKNATTYYYRVRAYKTVKGKKVYGGWSNVVSAVTGPATPKKPTIKSPNFETIKLELKSTKTADYYEIQRSTNKKKGFGTVSITKTLTFEDVVPTGTTFYYRVRACNTSDVCSGWTSVVSKKATLNKPKVKLVASEQGIVTLTNTEVDGAYEYEVQRSTNKKKGYKTFYINSGDALFLNEVASKKTYYYRVRAVRYVNGKKVYSAWSNSLKVKSLKINKNDQKANANRAAKLILFNEIISRKALIDKLVATGYTEAISTEVVDAIKVIDWNEEAKYMAMLLLQSKNYTRDELISALETSEGFTHEEAVYGADNCGAY